MGTVREFARRYLNRHLLIEVAPAITFFVANSYRGLMWATGAVIVATVVFTVLGLVLERRLPVFPLVTLFLVIALGGASLYFDNEAFIKVKPTVGKCLFAAMLGLGLLMRRSLLERALDTQIDLTGKGWRLLNLRWIGFALAAALTNEAVWRNFDSDTWVGFTTALTPVSVFAYIAITRFTAKHHWNEPEREGNSAPAS